MDNTYIVEWFGQFYGPFSNWQAAELFRPPVNYENAMARGTVHVLHEGRTLSPGEMQGRACFPNGR